MALAYRACHNLLGSGEEEEGQRLWLAILDLMVVKQREVKAARRAIPVGEAAAVAAAAVAAASSASTPHASALPSAAVSIGTYLYLLAPSQAFSASLGEGVRRLLKRMKSSVPLNTVLSRVLKDHAGAELGEFRDTIASMLSMVHNEKRMLKSALSLMATDVYRAAAKLYKGTSRGVLRDRADPDLARLETAGAAAAGKAGEDGGGEGREQAPKPDSSISASAPAAQPEADIYRDRLARFRAANARREVGSGEARLAASGAFNANTAPRVLKVEAVGEWRRPRVGLLVAQCKSEAESPF
jgi:hypothetical protein